MQFLYNENREVVAEKDYSGNIIRYIRGLGLISSDSENAKTYYHYVCDEQGSVSCIIRGEDKENGAAAQDKVSDRVLNHYEYDAFGNTISCEERVANRFRYQSGGKTTYKILNTSSAEDVNKIFKDTMGYEPPYKPGTSVTEIQLTENATYVRVYDKVNSRMQGGWVMKAEDIVGLTPQEIQNKFALPNTPKYICDVNLEAVTRLRTGEVNPLFGFDGGGQQYDLIINGKNVGTFTNERIIGQ